MKRFWESIKNKIEAVKWNAKIQKHITEKVYKMNNGKNVGEVSNKVYGNLMAKLNDGKEYTLEECLKMADETLEQVAGSIK